ncbi:MAG: hypothetical protein NVSMB18_03760 [Acetobacteraceae bacterium]
MALAMEAQHVVALRLMKIAQGGPAAASESRLMITEKLAASGVAAGLVWAASLRGAPDFGADTVVRMLRKRVQANRKRLAP